MFCKVFTSSCLILFFADLWCAIFLFPKLLKAADRVSVYDNTVGYKIALTKENGKYRIFPCEETIQKRLQKAVNEICRNEKQVAQNRANFINKKKSSDLER